MADHKFHCPQHGEQPATFVCQHIIAGLNEEVPYGFYWADEPDKPRPDAWCRRCNELLEAAGGQWTDAAEEEACVSMLCGSCYDEAKAMNVGR